MPIVDQLAGYDSYSESYIESAQSVSSVACWYYRGCWLLGHDVPELSVFRVAATSAAPAILLMNVSSFSAASLLHPSVCYTGLGVITL
ncbi:unnamed protein product [Fusarium graminearum]|uniref:Chromosome 4, complete genome n=1 Tax=Gibberella zeae (strain ATCC MYA-4620 / CBS 123657 / FGSC 9075 / NRRL 31084 / PH-1) TaxID=229533 RepID=A0A0E0S9P1_GIBZE|nr:hypothetical protein FG05_35312 [Fusarium graminearum]CEF83154.1 unnamed protein product [Fusarium graminearum]